MEYFKPELWLGMTATPDRRASRSDEVNIYELFNHQIAYEIRLQKAMEEDLFVLNVLGEEYSKCYLKAKKKEWDEYCRQVSQWEIDHYLYSC